MSWKDRVFPLVTGIIPGFLYFPLIFLVIGLAQVSLVLVHFCWSSALPTTSFTKIIEAVLRVVLGSDLCLCLRYRPWLFLEKIISFFKEKVTSINFNDVSFKSMFIQVCVYISIRIWTEIICARYWMYIYFYLQYVFVEI